MNLHMIYQEKKWSFSDKLWLYSLCDMEVMHGYKIIATPMPVEKVQVAAVCMLSLSHVLACMWVAAVMYAVTVYAEAHSPAPVPRHQYVRLYVILLCDASSWFSIVFRELCVASTAFTLWLNNSSDEIHVLPLVIMYFIIVSSLF